MPVFVQRRLALEAFDDGMGRFGEVVVPMRVRYASAVLMAMDVPREHSSVAAQRCIERIIRRFSLVAGSVAVTMVVIVPMVVLGKQGFVGVCVAAMLDRDHDVEPVRLRDLFEGLPIGRMVREQEELARSIGT